MDQGPLLSSVLPLPSEYSLQHESDCVDFSTPSSTSAYTSAGALDHLRRNESISQHSSYHFSDRNPSVTRFSQSGSVIAPETSSFRPANGFSDSVPGSISASPSSGASALQYNGFGQAGCTGLPSFSGPGSYSQTFVPPQAYCRLPTLLETSSSHSIAPHGLNIRSPLHSLPNATERESYQHCVPYQSRAQLSPGGYGSYTDTPRSVVASSPGLHYSLTGPGYHHPHMPAPMMAQGMSSVHQPNTSGTTENDSHRFPFLQLTCLGTTSFDDPLVHTDQRQVTCEIFSKVDKGFFIADDSKWTCYRRNYFAVTCSFSLAATGAGVSGGQVPNGAKLYHDQKENGDRRMIQAFGMKITAAIDGQNGKTIELIQHTPKRDAGPKLPVPIVKVMPTAGPTPDQSYGMRHPAHPMGMGSFSGGLSGPAPYLPLQSVNDSPDTPANTGNGQSSGLLSGSYGSTNGHLAFGTQSQHTFERVQFKCATANNGKRRASQQYFHLSVEVYADVRKDASDKPEWVKIANKSSEKIVVRGRSPSHYSDSNKNGAGSRSVGGGGHPSYTAAGNVYGATNAGGFRDLNSYAGRVPVPNGYLGSNANYALGEDEDTPSDQESAEGGASDEDHRADLANNGEHDTIADTNGYTYHPGPIYDHTASMLPVPKIEGSARCSTDPRQYAVTAEYADAVPGPQWPLHGGGRFQGFETSRGLFPDISAGHPAYT